MLKRHKELLRSNTVKLGEDLDMKLLFNHLLETRLLNSDDVEIIEHEKSKSAMAQKFVVHMLPRRGPEAFEKFIAALMNCEQQQFIAKYLDPELASRYDSGGGDSPDAPGGDSQASSSKKTDDEIIQEVTDLSNAFQTLQSTPRSFLVRLGPQDYYPMFRRVRGRAVIINNKYFVQSRTRDGCDNDVCGLDMLFKAIHFEVVPHADRTAQQIKDIIRDESRLDHSQADAFILFIMSHGEKGFILGMDDQKVNIDDEIIGVLGNCQSLWNKPKMLFFQACRVDPDHDAPIPADRSRDSGLWKMSNSLNQADHPSSGNARNLDCYADFFVAFSTISGFPALRHVVSGSWFVRFFIYVCSSEAHNSDLESIMTKVKRLLLTGLGRQQLAEHYSRLLHKVYFFPGQFQQPSA